MDSLFSKNGHDYPFLSLYQRQNKVKIDIFCFAELEKVPDTLQGRVQNTRGPLRTLVLEGKYLFLNKITVLRCNF